MKQNPVKKVAAIHDLSGFGRSSLTVVIPVLSSMGFQVCPLPTAVLSTHSQFSDYHFVDLTEHLPHIMHHWKSLNLGFDAIYSGFLGSSKQIDMMVKFIDDFSSEDTIVLVDPVLGDNGKLYGPFDQSMVNEMRKLVSKAHIITPNITEVGLLLEDDPLMINNTDDAIKAIDRLADFGPEIIVITSVPDGAEGKTSVIAHNKNDERYWKVPVDYLPAAYPGTGDTFASVLLGCLLQGDNLPMSLDRAVHFISHGVRSTFGFSYDEKEGILLEKILPTLNSMVQINSYEVLKTK
ncbi:MAG: pyridoxamine kinase [Salinivirgaceae bacterium]